MMLGMQLYDLIGRAGMEQQQVVAFYSFMTQLGMASQAIDIVYQLNVSGEDHDKAVYQQGESPLESLTFGATRRADVALKGLQDDERLIAFRYHDLILLKNQSSRGIVVRGRPLRPLEFCRIYSGQRIVLGEQVLTYQDLAYYFNAKKNVSLTSVFITVDTNDEVQLEKVRTRDSALEIVFGLKVTGARAARCRRAAQRHRAPQRHANRGGPRRPHHLPQRLRAAAERSPPPRPRARRTLPAQGLQERLPRLEQPVAARHRRHPALARHGRRSAPAHPLRLRPQGRQARGAPGGSAAIMVRDIAVPEKGIDRAARTATPSASIPARCCGAISPSASSRRSATSSRTLEVRDVTHYFRKSEPALDGITFSVYRGEIVCVMGASGCGKSTLMRTLAGQMQPQHGEVLLNGQSLYGDLDDAQAFHLVHPAGRRLRRASHDRGKPRIRRRHPLAAPLLARPLAADRRQAGRARALRAARFGRRQRR